MAYNEISRLKSIVVDGFFMNGVLSLLKGMNILVDKEERNSIIEKALEYIKKIKQGKQFMKDGIYIKDLEECSEAYTIGLDAFELYEREINKHPLTEESFEKIVSIIEKELNEAHESGEIDINKLENAIKIFNLIRVVLLKKADMVLPREKEIFI